VKRGHVDERGGKYLAYTQGHGRQAVVAGRHERGQDDDLVEVSLRTGTSVQLLQLLPGVVGSVGVGTGDRLDQLLGLCEC
jgi:hypothetical protein